MARLDDIHREQSAYLDAMTEAFRTHLEDVVNRAVAKLSGYLHNALKFGLDGKIAQTGTNQRVMRKLDEVFMKFLDDAGYGRLLDAFIGEFHQQITFLQQTLDYLSDQTKVPLPKLEWSAQDLQVFKGFRLNAISALEASMEAGAGVAMQRAMLSVGGLSFSDLVKVLSEKYHASVGRTTAIADTAMSMFYRTASDRAFDIIQKDLPSDVLRFRYSGPLDKVTRPFCKDVLARTNREPMTKTDIQALDNGQIPNPFLSGGGWNCRHTWIVDISRFQKKAA